MKSNIDEVLKEFEWLEAKTGTELLRDLKRELHKVLTLKKGAAEKETPEKSGRLKKSIEVQGRTYKNMTDVKLVWTAAHAWLANKIGKSAGFVDDFINNNKADIEEESRLKINQTIEIFLKSRGFAVK